MNRPLIRILSLLFLLVMHAACAQKKKLNITLYCLQPYCGGARPTPEILAEAEKPRPYAGQTVIFVSDNGKVDSSRTDAQGKISKKIAFGKYTLYESWRFYRKAPDGEELSSFDKNCLEAEWKKPIMTVTFSKKETVQSSKEALKMECPHKLPCRNSHNPPPMRE